MVCPLQEPGFKCPNHQSKPPTRGNLSFCGWTKSISHPHFRNPGMISDSTASSNKRSGFNHSSKVVRTGFRPSTEIGRNSTQPKQPSKRQVFRAAVGPTWQHLHTLRVGFLLPSHWAENSRIIILPQGVLFHSPLVLGQAWQTSRNPAPSRVIFWSSKQTPFRIKRGKGA